MGITSLKDNYTGVPDVAAQGGGGDSSGVRATPESFGAGVGAAVEKAGNTGFDVAQHFQEMAVHTATNDAYVNGYAPAVNSIVSDYKKLSGTDALKQLPVYQGQLQAVNNKYLNEGSPLQRELMGGLVARHTISTMDSMSNHADQQYMQHEKIITDQSIKNASDEAANNWQDPGSVDFNVNRAMGVKRLDTLRTIGDSSDPTNALVSEKMAKEEGSKVAANAINMALDNGDYRTANLYKNKYSDILSGKDKLAIEKSVSALNITANARNYVDNILTGSPAIPPGTPHYEELQTKATVADIAQKENFDPNIAFALHGTESDYGKGIKPTSARQDDFQTDVRLRDKGFEGDDLASSAHNGFKIWNTNTADLAQRLGRPLSGASEGYLAYNQGGLGAATLLNASADETAVQALSKVMPPQDALKHVINNGGTPTMAASDFSNHIQAMFQNHYDTQKVTVAGDPSKAITEQAKIQTPAIQQTSNPHEYFNQINERLPSAQAAVDAIPDDKMREVAQKQLKLKYEQAKLGDTAWKNTQAQTAQTYAQDPRYASLDEIPQTVKNNLQSAGQLKFLEAAFTDKNNPKKDSTYGAGFLPTLNRLSTDDPTDRIADLAALQQEYGERKDLHTSGFKQLSNMLKLAGTPEGKASIATQAQFLSDLRQKMVAGESDVEGKANFEKALPLFFSAYGAASAGKEKMEDIMSLDPNNSDSFIAKSGIKVPTSAQMTSKKIQNSVQTISEMFGAAAADNTASAVNSRLAVAPPAPLSKEAQARIDRLKNSTIQVPRPE